mgnify:FL=1
MVELTWYQNNNVESEQYKKWYVRPVIKEMLGIREMAQHMAEHNTPFSAGTIEGILTDFSKCIREQLLNGNSVKIDNLAIFKITLHSNSFDTIAGINPTTGRLGAAAKMGSAVRKTRMLASATGDMMSDQLALDVTFGWDTESQARIDAEKKKVGESIEHLEELGEQVEKEQEAAAGGTQNNTAAHDGEGTEPVTGNAPETDAGGGGSDDTGGDDANAEK